MCLCLFSQENKTLEQTVYILLEAGWFVGGFVAFVFDNILPGTSVERGMESWRRQLTRHTVKFEEDRESPSNDIYDLPWFSKRKARWWFKYVPFLPSFDEELINWQNIKHKV